MDKKEKILSSVSFKTIEEFSSHRDALLTVFRSVCGAKRGMHLFTAVNEAANNAVFHANKGFPDARVDILAVEDGKDVSVSVRSEMGSFEHDLQPDPGLFLDLQKESGRGMQIILHMVDEVRIEERGRVIVFGMRKADRTERSIHMPATKPNGGRPDRAAARTPFPLSIEIAGFRFNGMNMLDMFEESLVMWEATTGKILYMNEAARALYDYPLAETAGLSIDDIFPTRDVSSGKLFSVTTTMHRRKGGVFFPVQATLRSLAQDTDEIMMMVVTDISPETLAREDVALASVIQRGFLPGDLVGEPDVEVRSIFRPMFMISGDLFGYHWDTEKRVLNGYIFDLMGHGVPAALQTSAMLVLFRQAFEDEDMLGASLLEKLQWVNAIAAERFLSDSFAAAICFSLNLKKMLLSYCSAGINAFLHGSNGVMSKASSPGSLLGLSRRVDFGCGDIPVKSGDYFVFTSDGFLDLMQDADDLEMSFYEAYDHLFTIGYSGASRDDLSALCVHVR
ncbi:MAG: SpoIIE family protein phosphatase [Aminobacteriaceae bacterium]